MKIPMPEISLEEQLQKMQRDWDERARENARYYVATGKNDWSDDEFFQSGERTIAEEKLVVAPVVFPGGDVVAGINDWSDDEFFQSGERTIAEEILTDTINICQGKDPKQMRVSVRISSAMVRSPDRKNSSS